jgi:hypothetical protein
VDNITTNFWDVLLWSFWFFVLIAAFSIWIWAFFDVFKDHTLGGGAKAGWVVLLIILPAVGVLIYLIVRDPAKRGRQAQGTRS